jgi:hypothetical protein
LFKYPDQYKTPGLFHPFKSKILKIDLIRFSFVPFAPITGSGVNVTVSVTVQECTELPHAARSGRHNPSMFSRQNVPESAAHILRCTVPCTLCSLAAHFLNDNIPCRPSPIIVFNHGDAISLALPCGYTDVFMTSFPLFPI